MKAFVLATALTASSAAAQINYRIGNFVADGSVITWPPGGGWQPLTSGTDIHLGTLAASTDIVVQIADMTPDVDGNPSRNSVSTPTDADLGDLRLIAGAASVAPRRVRIWIANKNLNPLSFNIDNLAQPWTSGIRDWSGKLFCLDSTLADWHDLRDVVRLNANISHNYTGAWTNEADGAEAIDCGSIIRFRAEGIQDDPLDVEAGQISGFLRGRFNYTPVGHTATPLENGVGLISARHRIRGAICAGDATMDTPAIPVIIAADEPFYGATLGCVTNLANVGSVIVGPNVQVVLPGPPAISGETAYGVDAHIAARRGVIREILSTGEIKNLFEAGNGVWVVRQATAENDTGGAGSDLAYNFDLTKRGMSAQIVANLFTPGYLPAKSIGKGAIRLVEVVGSVIGNITADNVYWNAPNEPTFDEQFVPNPLVHRRHRGILVWDGGMNGSVNIRYNLEQADIIAAGLKGGVWIGLSARGSVVAYGAPSDTIYFGLVQQLTIGYTPDYLLTDPPQPEANPHDILPPAYAGYSRGLRGSAVSPLEMGGVYGQNDWKNPHSSTDPTGPMVYDGGSVDCVVRFTATDPGGTGGSWPVRIYNMHQYNPKPSNGQDPEWRVNPYRPRVEAPQSFSDVEGLESRYWFSFMFGNWADSAMAGGPLPGTPIGGGIESGIVWTGRVGFPVADWFALTSSFKARALGSNADVWLDVTSPVGPGRCSIDGDMNGRLRVHGLPTNRSVLIGERLGTSSDVGFLEALHDHAITAFSQTLENSPRGTYEAESWPAAAGEVNVLNDILAEDWFPGLDGQIVVDRWNTTGVQRQPTHCAGSVLIADTTGAAGGARLEPGSFYGPLYYLARYDMRAGPPVSPLDVVLGTDANGGAVGLAPYAMHAEDCLPANRRTWGLATAPPVPDIPNLVIPGSGVVPLDQLRTRFYGPILPDATFEGLGVRVQYEPSNAYTGFSGTPEDVTGEWAIGFPAVAPFPRDVQIQPLCGQSYRAGIYRIVRAQDVPVPPEGSPPADRLRSDLTNTVAQVDTSYPPDMQPVAEFAHYFRLCDCGPADLGTTGGVPGADCQLDNNDFIVFIDYFFNHNPLADVGTTGGVPGSDGVWDNNDFVVFIDLFFAGCTNKFEGTCEFGMAGRGARTEGSDADAESDQRASVQASIRSLLTAAMERMPSSDRQRFQSVLQSGRDLTREDLVSAFEAVFATGQQAP